MDEKRKILIDILFRYSVLIALAVSNFWIFYLVFTPLTVYSTYFLLAAIFKDTLLMGNVILINNDLPIELIKACIAGSAYYLLFMLNLAIPKIKIGKRVKMILLAFSIFLVFNILRITFLSAVFLNDISLFISLHKFFWYFLSTFFVAGIWFFEVWLFGIRGIPFYSDLEFLHKHSFLKK